MFNYNFIFFKTKINFKIFLVFEFISKTYNLAWVLNVKLFNKKDLHQ